MEAQYSLDPAARRQYVLLCEVKTPEQFFLFTIPLPSKRAENNLEELVRLIHVVFATARHTLRVGYPLFTARRLLTGTPMWAGEKTLAECFFAACLSVLEHTDPTDTQLTELPCAELKPDGWIMSQKRCGWPGRDCTDFTAPNSFSEADRRRAGARLVHHEGFDVSTS